MCVPYTYVALCTYAHHSVHTVHATVDVHASQHRYVRTYVCTYIHTYIHTDIHTYIRTTHIYKCTHACMQWWPDVTYSIGMKNIKLKNCNYSTKHYSRHNVSHGLITIVRIRNTTVLIHRLLLLKHPETKIKVHTLSLDKPGPCFQKAAVSIILLIM